MTRENKRHLDMLRVLKIVSDKDLADLSRVQDDLDAARNIREDIQATLRIRAETVLNAAAEDLAFQMGQDSLWVSQQQGRLREQSIKIAQAASLAEQRKNRPQSLSADCRP